MVTSTPGTSQSSGAASTMTQIQTPPIPSAQPAPSSVSTDSPPPGASANSHSAGQSANLHRVSVQVGGQNLELLSPRPLRPGMNVELTRNSNEQVQLQIPPPAVKPEQQRQLQESLQQILRDTLPQQLPLGEAFNQLRQLSQRGNPQDAIGRVVQSMLSLFSVSPETTAKETQSVIQRHLAQSGFTGTSEAGASAGRQTEPSMQQHLARLSQLAEKLPPQAREQMQSLLDSISARRSSQQIESVQRWRDQPDGAIERQYRLDLPIRVSPDRLDNTEIRISQHRSGSSDAEQGSEWSISLHFALEQLGSIDVRVSLQQEWQLNARFWAEQPDTVQTIRNQLASFEERLRGNGFEVEALQVQLGRRPQETPAVISHRLVDLHT